MVISWIFSVQPKLEDPCLDNTQEVAPDSKETEGGMVKSVPIAIPSTHEVCHNNEIKHSGENTHVAT